MSVIVKNKDGGITLYPDNWVPTQPKPKGRPPAEKQGDKKEDF